MKNNVLAHAYWLASYAYHRIRFAYMLTRCMYAMTGALTPAATTFAEVTAEAHSDCTRKTILDMRRHHSTSDMGTRSSPPQQRHRSHTAFPATCIANMTPRRHRTFRLPTYTDFDRLVKT